MDFITETLGITVKYEPWNDFDGLPMLIPSNYEIQKANLDGFHCLLVKPRAELPTIPALKRHIEILGEKAGMPRVAVLDAISARQRKALINARIPFVVEKKQIYLPFMGVALSEQFSKPKPIIKALIPTAQMLLFHYIYQGEGRLFTNPMAKRLNVSNMQITRAVEQLSALGIAAARKDGVRIYIEGMEKGAALFGKAKPFLLNPVRKKLYVDADSLPGGLLYAGLTALSEYSMLAPPRIPVYAYFGKTADLHGTDTLVDNGQAEVEIWRYNPAILCGNERYADLLSVIASLQGNDDPRVQQTVEETISKIWENENG